MEHYKDIQIGQEWNLIAHSDGLSIVSDASLYEMLKRDELDEGDVVFRINITDKQTVKKVLSLVK